MKTFADFGITISGSGEKKVTCPQCSGARKKKNYPCLNVNIDKGVWNCWHCGWTGTLKGGVQDAPKLLKEYRKPDYAPTASAAEKASNWFESRGISEAVLKRNNIGVASAYFPQVESEVSCVAFPYFRGTEIVNVKYRTKDKMFRMASGCERILYGLNDVAETTIWVEGEMDKLSLEVAGFQNCVSVPDGAPAVTAKNYEGKFEFLACEQLAAVKTHIIAVDMDPPGQKLRDELVRRLGPEKCLIVTWPDGCKDANDVLLEYGAAEIDRCIKAAQPLPVAGAYGVDDYAEELRQLYEHGTPRGISTGWAGVDEYYTVRSGDITVVTGIPNSGKSEWLDALFINQAASSGWVFAVYSPENWPVPEHIKKLAEKRIGKPFDPGPTQRMSVAEWDQAQTWLKNYFVFIEPEEPTLDSVLNIGRQLVLRNGIRGLVIDPWNEIEHTRPAAMGETEYISQSLSKIRRFARNHGVHVWVVAHPTKLVKDKDGAYPVPTPYDIAGSAHWRNKPDNCITVWRDFNNQDVEIHIQKVRHKVVGKIGMAKIKYDRVTGRYFEPRKYGYGDRDE